MFTYCIHLPTPTETYMESSQKTQDETVGEYCIDDVWDQQHDRNEDEPQNIHDESLEHCMHDWIWKWEIFFMHVLQSSLFASFFPTSEEFSKRELATNHSQRKDPG